MALAAAALKCRLLAEPTVSGDASGRWAEGRSLPSAIGASRARGRVGSPEGPERSGGVAQRLDAARTRALRPSVHAAAAWAGPRMARNSLSRSRTTRRVDSRSPTAFASASSAAKETPGLRKRSAPSTALSRS